VLEETRRQKKFKESLALEWRGFLAYSLQKFSALFCSCDSSESSIGDEENNVLQTISPLLPGHIHNTGHVPPAGRTAASLGFSPGGRGERKYIRNNPDTRLRKSCMYPEKQNRKRKRNDATCLAWNPDGARPIFLSAPRPVRKLRKQPLQ
jgi:hypothetical protein